MPRSIRWLFFLLVVELKGNIIKGKECNLVCTSMGSPVSCTRNEAIRLRSLDFTKMSTVVIKIMLGLDRECGHKRNPKFHELP